jgi:hypothetical protein
VNIKKYLAASVAVFIVFALVDLMFDFFVLGTLSHSVRNVWRPNMIHWLEPVTYLAASLLFVFLLARLPKTMRVSSGMLFLECSSAFWSAEYIHSDNMRCTRYPLVWRLCGSLKDLFSIQLRAQ